jgi:hypothetical protein
MSRRLVLAWLAVPVAVLFSRDASALDALACEAKYESAQELALAAKLLEARAAYRECLQDSCPALLRSDCLKRYEDVGVRVPSIILAARGAAGQDLVDVEIDLDGRRVASRVTGTALETNPGPHRVRFSRGGRAEDFEIVVREGEKLRTIVHELRDAPPQAASAAPSAGARWPAYAAAGVGAVAFASFAFFGIRGVTDAQSLHEQCAPHCSQSAETNVHTELVVADISLGIGVVASAVALWLFLRDDGAASAPKAALQSTLRSLAGAGFSF